MNYLFIIIIILCPKLNFTKNYLIISGILYFFVLFHIYLYFFKQLREKSSLENFIMLFIIIM